MPLDDTLLRSVITFPGDASHDVFANLMALRLDVVPTGIEAHILGWLGSIADRVGTPPTIDLVIQHYQGLELLGDTNGFTGRTKLEALAAMGLPLLSPLDYRVALDRYRERILGDGVGDIMQKATTILTSGYTPPPVRGVPSPTLQGAEVAIDFVYQQLATLTSQFKSGVGQGSFRDLGQVFNRYQARAGKAPTGIQMGYRDLDAYHRIEYGDLVLILGYTGQMKSTLTFNIAYNAVIRHHHNVALISMEMSAAGLQDAMVVMHCVHDKFGAFDIAKGITYDRLRAGTLTKIETDLIQTAIADLETCPDYGQFVYYDPDRDLNVGDVKRWAEQEHRKTPLDLLAVDYAGLINPTGGGVSMKESAFANVAMREFKQLARTFALGRGIGVLSPFQSNREGFKEAQKNGGRYELRALAWAPEAERSADLVYYVYRDDTLRGANQLQIGNIKARDRRLIDQSFTVFAWADHKLIEDIDPTKLYQSTTPVPDFGGLPQPPGSPVI